MKASLPFLPFQDAARLVIFGFIEDISQARILVVHQRAKH